MTTPSTLTSSTLTDLSRLLKNRQCTSRELTQAHIDRIDTLDSRLRAFITPTLDDALRDADRADARLSDGDWNPLLGIPIGLKDVICTRGVRTTCGSRILSNYVSPFDATVVSRLRERGAVFMGKLNLDEFAMGSSCENSAFFPTANPWDLSRTPGGSSGGPACAVASGECVAAIGSDTGGSIRQPAAMCGIVGVKPTYGRVSRFGLVAFASSLDQLGPLARTVRDASVMLEAISGYDSLDATSANVSVPDFSAALDGGIKGLKVGLPKEYFIEGIDPPVAAAVRSAAQVLAALGAEIQDISLPHTEYGIAAYYVCATAEASSNLARYDGMQYGLRSTKGVTLADVCTESRTEGFGLEVKRRIMLGTYALSSGYYDAYYLKASKVRNLIKRDFDNAFTTVDLIMTPTSPSPPFRLGEKVEDPLKMYLADIFTIGASLAGLPALSLCCGFTSNSRLPIGLQLIAPSFQETTMLRTAHAYEQSTPFTTYKPSL